MKPMPRVAVVQFQFELHRPEANLQRAEKWVREAAGQKADIVAFPELFLTGPLMGRMELADEKGRYREVFRDWARRYRIDVVGGSVVEKVGRRFFNASYYIDRRGRVLARYCKVNLWLTEKAWVTPGREAVTAATRWGPIGLSVCWDLAFPELYRAMFRQGARLMFCCACWLREDAGDGLRYNRNAEAFFIDSCSAARALENEAALAFCNVAGGWRGRTGDVHSSGRTRVVLPFVGPVAAVSGGREGMAVAGMDPAILVEAERAYEIRKDLPASARKLRRGTAATDKSFGSKGCPRAGSEKRQDLAPARVFSSLSSSSTACSQRRVALSSSS